MTNNVEVIKRRIGETIVISDNIFVTILRIEGNDVRIAFDAPRNTKIECLTRQKDNEFSAETDLSS